MGNPFGRNTVIPLTNKSGGSVAAGDMVIVDTSNNDAFTTTTTAGYTKGVGIAQQAIASNAVGLVLIDGYASLVNVNASVTRGNFLKTHTVAKQGTDAGSSRGAGTCGIFLTGGTTPDAIIWQPDLGGSGENVATSAIWTAAGQLALATGSGAASALAIGAANKVLASNGSTASWVYPAAHGCKAYSAATQTVTSFAVSPLVMGSEEYDSDAYHFTSAAALTGTVTKTASSAAIVGSGTSFTTELTVNQVISIPGTAVEIGVVKIITDNTHITLWQTMANSASGQTATRRNEFYGIPAGLGGKYSLIAATNVASGLHASNPCVLFWQQNGVDTRNSVGASIVTATESGISTVDVSCADGDYLAPVFYNGTAGSVTIGHASAPSQQSTASIAFLGA